MYAEEDLLPLSGLQHLAFCERQWALIHLEQTWAENRLTVEGRHLHERVHDADSETREGVRTVRGLRLRSLRLGLSGQADVVEFHRTTRSVQTPFPVEFKRGRPKPDRCDEVQLCAQALCLEEMMQTRIDAGALFYGQPRRRREVLIDDDLRNETEALSLRMHELWNNHDTPRADYEPKCDRCSLRQACLPEVAGRGKSASRYLAQMWRGGEEDPLDNEPPA